MTHGHSDSRGLVLSIRTLIFDRYLKTQRIRFGGRIDDLYVADPGIDVRSPYRSEPTVSFQLIAVTDAKWSAV